MPSETVSAIRTVPPCLISVPLSKLEHEVADEEDDYVPPSQSLKVDQLTFWLLAYVLTNLIVNQHGHWVSILTCASSAGLTSRNCALIVFRHSEYGAHRQVKMMW